MTPHTRLVLLACLFWLVVALVHIAGSKAGLWSSLPYPARYYGENPTEAP